MEKRIGTVLILIEDKESVNLLNNIISRHGEMIIGRLGVPRKDEHFSIISLLLEGNTDEIGSLTGQIGKLSGIRVKSLVLSKEK